MNSPEQVVRCVLCNKLMFSQHDDEAVVCGTKTCKMFAEVIGFEAAKALSAKLGGAVDETAWLVEDSHNSDPIRYRTMDQCGIHWTEDVHKAIRFARREDAEIFAAGDAVPLAGETEEIIQRLRGQLQNCVNHLDRAKRRGGRDSYDAAIESANKTLYETLIR